MPSLKLFGQHTPVAGDDLGMYSFFFLLMRLSQLGVAISLLVRTFEVVDNQNSLIRSANETFQNSSDYAPALADLVITESELELLQNDNPQDDPLLTQLKIDMYQCLDAKGEDFHLTYQRVTRMNYSYLTLAIFMATSGVLFASAVCRVSGRGTPTNGEISILHWPGRSTDGQRKHFLQALCHIHLTIFAAIRLTVAVVGFILYDELDDLCSCATKLILENDDAPDYGCKGTVMGRYYFLTTTHILELIMNGVVISYCSAKALCGTRAFGKISKKLLIPRTMGSETQWRLFCRCCCTLTSVASCFMFGGSEAALGDFTEIAMLLADFFDFHGTLDVAPTDAVAALLLLGEVQSQRIQDSRRRISVPLNTIDFKSTLDLMMEEGVTTNTDSIDTTGLEGKSTDTSHCSLDDGVKVTKRVVKRRLKRADNSLKITYRLKRHEGAEWKWEAHSTKVLDPHNAADVMTIAEGARFMQLSMAIYTWVMSSFNKPCSGCCEIGCFALARDCRGERPEEPYDGDGYCCRLHSAAFLREAGISNESDVVYAYFRSGVVEAPHAVVLDHAWKSVVIVIRGTLSLEDIMADLTLKPTSMEDVGKEYGFDGSDKYAHGGMLATCQWILKGLKERRILDKLFVSKSPFTNYQLRVTGHSLGAGVAAILAMMLRPQHPQIKCHSFSPPGCTMSENAAKDCEEFITAYILDADIIPRASLNSLENLRHDMVDIISRVKVPKNQIFDEFTGCSLRRRKDRSTILDRLLYEEDETPTSKFTKDWREYRAKYDAKRLERGSHLVELFPPGTLVQLFPSEGIVEDTEFVHRGNSCPLSRGGADKRPFSCRWANRLDFREIRISSHFVDDHLPLAVLTRLEDEAEKFGLAPPYLVEVQSESTEREEKTPVINVRSIFVGLADELAGEEEEEGVEITFRP